MTAPDSSPPPRIAPLQPPLPAEQQALLERMTPPGAPNILALFRTLAHHPVLAERMAAWGGFLLGRHASLPLRERELVIGRVCARCGAEYEWGVHVAAFAKAAGFTPQEVAAVADSAADLSSLSDRDRLLVQMADELHETSTVSDALWARLAALWSEPQLIELLMLAGWYRAISYVCNATRVPLESWGARWARQDLAKEAKDPAPARQLIGSGSTFEQEIGYSRAVVDGDWIFVSGTTGFDYATMTIAPGVVEQAEQCLRNIGAALQEAGASLGDVVRVTHVLPDARDFEACWPVLRKYLGQIRPAAMMISAGLADPRMRIEIEVTARKRA